jgi:hypothetical protein
LIKAIVEVVAAGGNVLIPAFALGRAQEIILAIRTSALFHSVNVPVYVDGLVREVTDLFQNQLDLLPAYPGVCQSHSLRWGIDYFFIDSCRCFTFWLEPISFIWLFDADAI